MDVISLQSRVSRGYVGNAVAVPVLEATGATVWPIDSVIYAHHPGHGPVTPEITPHRALAACLEEAVSRSTPPATLLSGYLASAGQGRTALEHLDRARNTGRINDYFLDPVFGDDAEGTYVDPSMIAFFRDEALPFCTALLPNRYELAVLADASVETVADAVRAAKSLMQRGPTMVLASSVPVTGDRLANVLVLKKGAFAVEVDKLPLRAKGTGDMLNAAFIGLFTGGMDACQAMEQAVAVVAAAVDDASAINAPELDLSKIQEAFNLEPTLDASCQPIESLEQ